MSSTDMQARIDKIDKNKRVIGVIGALIIIVGIVVHFVGIQVDISSHINGLVLPDDPFWSPAHYALWIGLLIIALPLIPNFAINVGRYIWAYGTIFNRQIFFKSVPFYEDGRLMFYGFLVSLFGMFADNRGHEVWGFEAGIPSLYAPFHVITGLFGLLPMMGGIYLDNLKNRPGEFIAIFKKIDGRWTVSLKDTMALVSRGAGLFILTTLVHHFSPFEQSFQKMAQNLKLMQFDDLGNRMMTILPESYRHVSDVSVIGGIGSYLITGILIMGTYYMVVSPRHKVRPHIVFIDFLIIGLPATFFNNNTEIYIAILVNAFFQALLQWRFPLFRMENKSNFWKVGAGIPTILYLVLTLTTAIQGQLWWVDYVVLGGIVMTAGFGAVYGYLWSLQGSLENDIARRDAELADINAVA